MALYDGKGNPVSVGSDGLATMLPGADIVVFGDSNVYYTYGHALTDNGSVFYRLWKEFGINSLTNNGGNGAKTANMFGSLTRWATEENIAAYNKENTILIFHVATNDPLGHWTGEYTYDYSNKDTWGQMNNSVWSMGFISQFISENLPKCKYFWVIPTATDWSKWTGSTEADDRNMDEKYPYILKNLNLWHFPYIDAYNQSGITTDMLSDGIHLGGGGFDYTTVATEKFYRFLRGKLITL